MNTQHYKRKRWYDKYPKIIKILELLQQYPESDREILLKNVIETANIIKKNRVEYELVSLGVEKVAGLYHSQNKNRWYDRSPSLTMAMNVLTAMNEEDFLNVVDTLFLILFHDEIKNI
ncbi:MAG TPA: hypothetical protein H9673_02055 [Candidatus Adamsella sp.]|nr:hypothetical protein [Candidatus Adamsella sp.]